MSLDEKLMELSKDLARIRCGYSFNSKEYKALLKLGVTIHKTRFEIEPPKREPISMPKEIKFNNCVSCGWRGEPTTGCPDCHTSFVE